MEKASKVHSIKNGAMEIIIGEIQKIKHFER